MSQQLNPAFSPLEQVDTIMQHAEGLSERKDVYTGSELLKRNIENIPCLLEPIVPKVGLVAIAGSSDTGKSSFLRQLAISVCIGLPEFLCFRLNTAYRSAIYVSTEDDDAATAFLLHKANKALNFDAIKYNRLRYIFDTNDLLTKLDTQLSIAPADCVIIDCFTDLYGKSMTDSNQVRTFLNDYSQLAQKHGCLVVFLHHTGKRTEELQPSKHNLLGSQGFEAKMRLVIELRADNMTPDKRHLCIVKGNYLSKEYKTESFVLLFDENLQFTMTDERQPFDEFTSVGKTAMKERVKNLSSQGKLQSEIANELRISQATVSRYLRE